MQRHVDAATRMQQGRENDPVRVLVSFMLRSAEVVETTFVLSGSLFALSAVFAQLGVGTLVTVNITYLVGGSFFSLGG